MRGCSGKGRHLLASPTVPGLDQTSGVCCDHNLMLLINNDPLQRTLHGAAPQQLTLGEEPLLWLDVFNSPIISSGYEANKSQLHGLNRHTHTQSLIEDNSDVVALTFWMFHARTVPSVEALQTMVLVFQR